MFAILELKSAQEPTFSIKPYILHKNYLFFWDFSILPCVIVIIGIFMEFAFSKIFNTVFLFFVTALMEILGCYFPYLILNQNKSQWLWIPTALALAAFVWLLTLHPAASGRIYAAYGGIYIMSALLWLKFVDGVDLTKFDLLGGLIVMVGALTIILQPQGLIR